MAAIRVMVLDDSTISLRFTRAYLEGLNFDVRTASSVVEFLGALKDFNPDVILTDVEMPESSGDELCQVLRRNVDTANTPIVLFSSLPAHKLQERASKAGADGFVCKTDGPAALLAVLNAVIKAKA